MITWLTILNRDLSIIEGVCELTPGFKIVKGQDYSSIVKEGGDDATFWATFHKLSNLAQRFGVDKFESDPLIRSIVLQLVIVADPIADVLVLRSNVSQGLSEEVLEKGVKSMIEEMSQWPHSEPGGYIQRYRVVSNLLAYLNKLK